MIMRITFKMYFFLMFQCIPVYFSLDPGIVVSVSELLVHWFMFVWIKQQFIVDHTKPDELEFILTPYSDLYLKHQYTTRHCIDLITMHYLMI